MSILTQEDKKTLKTRFRKELKKDITINLFSVRTSGLLILPGRDCPTCPQAQSLLEEVVAVTPKLSLEVYDFYSDQEAVQQQDIERIPC
ncbi:glutaredoxin, partial [SAR202 cluster bacterium AD-802-E10_MRT_200m]|nr:glutaredoxin [SAR202 cluster bacterium AD-802-E10_MRT_200m]